LCGVAGAFVGTLTFAQLLSCVGYYVGVLLGAFFFGYGFDQQPPVGPVIIGALVGAAVGFILGGFAGVFMLYGRRPRATIVTTVCLVNILALMGTIDLSFELSLQSNTVRTGLVGTVCGILAGAILSILFSPSPAGWLRK
jgi:hypothetical protein